ncbi:glycosyltransferase family 4 protein [Halogeometricum borinquense]|uniref:glycosyltransferase family 4 protein n=1 Tax=Halogeometricum borinquense TaxID=60847 RepID=UPI0019551148|nr:glycosyltransferase family 4 protein [Halogeometricum borinquense]
MITREFPPYVAGGISYHLKYLYSKIEEIGHDVTILAGRPRAIEKQSSVEVPQTIDVEWVDYFSMSGYHLQYPTALAKKLRDFNIGEYDIALTHTEIPYSLGIPTIHKVHDAKHIERSFSRERMGSTSKMLDSALAKTRRWVTQRALDCADALIFNSDLTRSVWENQYDISVPSNTIYNGVDREIFYPREVEKEDFILFVGDSPRKGFPKVKSFAENSPYPVYVVGDVDDSQHLHSLGRLSQDELAQYYSSAVATIHPAKFEAFGNVILESLACGTPVVVSDRCGAAEIIDDSCGEVTTNLSAGIEAVRDLDSEGCLQTAKRYSWAEVANDTTSFLKRMRSCSK